MFVSRVRKMTMAIAVLAMASTLPIAAQNSRLYPNPSEATNQKYRNNPCSDPWISYAWVDVSAGTDVAPGAGKDLACNPAAYHNGQWSSYADLVDAVKAVRNDMNSQSIRMFRFNGRTDHQVHVAVTTLRGEVIGGGLVGPGGSSIISEDPASVVSQGGGNVVSQGGGNIIVVQGSNYSVQSASGKPSFRIGTAKLVVR